MTNAKAMKTWSICPSCHIYSNLLSWRSISTTTRGNFTDVMLVHVENYSRMIATVVPHVFSLPRIFSACSLFCRYLQQLPIRKREQLRYMWICVFAAPSKSEPQCQGRSFREAVPENEWQPLSSACTCSNPLRPKVATIDLDVQAEETIPPAGWHILSLQCFLQAWTLPDGMMSEKWPSLMAPTSANSLLCACSMNSTRHGQCVLNHSSRSANHACIAPIAPSATINTGRKDSLVEAWMLQWRIPSMKPLANAAIFDPLIVSLEPLCLKSAIPPDQQKLYKNRCFPNISTKLSPAFLNRKISQDTPKNP